MKALLALAVALFLAAPAWADGNGAPPFPFAAYPEARSITPARCATPSFVAILSDDWRTLSSETRDVFVHLTNGEADYVYLAVGSASIKPVITRVLTIDEARRLYPDHCAWLAEVQA